MKLHETILECRKQIPEDESLVDQEYVRTEYVLNRYLEFWRTEPVPEVHT